MSYKTMHDHEKAPSLYGDNGVIPQQWEHLLEENRKLKDEVSKLQKAESLLHCICAEELVSFASYDEYRELYPEFVK